MQHNVVPTLRSLIHPPRSTRDRFLSAGAGARGTIHGMARPTKLTPDVRDRVATMIRSGAYAEQAARAAGIAPSTYYSWLERGEGGERPFSEFSEAVKTAEAQAEQQRVEHIQDAADAGTWQAAAWWLERRFPGRWGRRSAEPPARSPAVSEYDLDAEVDRLLEQAVAAGAVIQSRA